MEASGKARTPEEEEARVLELWSAPWNSRILKDSGRLSLKSPVETM